MLAFHRAFPLDLRRARAAGGRDEERKSYRRKA
jgi:hypothetical protein